MPQCPECEMFSAPPLMAAWAAAYQHEDGCTYDPESFDHDEIEEGLWNEDDGYRYDPVEGESRIVECPYKMCGGH